MKPSPFFTIFSIFNPSFTYAIGLYYSEDPEPYPCPPSLAVSGSDPLNWTDYHDLKDLRACRSVIIFDLALHFNVDDPNRQLYMRATKAPGSGLVLDATNSSIPVAKGKHIAREEAGPLYTNNTTPAFNSTASHNTRTLPMACGRTDAKIMYENAAFELQWAGATRSNGSAERDFSLATKALLDFLATQPSCGPSFFLTMSGPVIIGVYAGSQHDKKTASTILQKEYSLRKASGGDLPTVLAGQVCQENAQGMAVSSQTLGIVAHFGGSLMAVLKVVQGWDDGKCASVAGRQGAITSPASLSLLPPAVSLGSGLLLNATVKSNATAAPTRTIAIRDGTQEQKTCTALQAEGGDGCATLADKCSKVVGHTVSQDNFILYNDINGGSRGDFCSGGILKGNHYCCSRGPLPDFSPQPSGHMCFSYTVQPRDNCASIAAAHSMLEKYDNNVDVVAHHIDTYNRRTWGWSGCNNLQQGMAICLSLGNPPMPNPRPTAICGPTVNNTKRPDDWSTIADLNPCPLNVCCNVWGNCGLSPDFCIPAPVESGGPGSAKPGSNGCVSNCGLDLKTTAPSGDTKRIAYFESWNFDRHCLNMDVSKMAGKDISPTGDGYTHVHYAFVDINLDFTLDISKNQQQFEGFVKLQGVKRIMSMGGWAFSNDASFYQRFRQASANDANRQKLAQSVADVVSKNNLDGVDFDWEYPGATDIPGTPPGADPKEEGDNYYQMLQAVRDKLKTLPGKPSLSIAAPSSYWYLRSFPIKKIADNVVDYIVYMTYDLHGLWDRTNHWANPGCEGAQGGNCLRSHVNWTETKLSLLMMDKAGVPRDKIAVGMALYGRSFTMADSACTGPLCQWSGDPTPGPCTNVSGYISNYELWQIATEAESGNGTSTFRQYKDEGSDIMIYNSNQWVSYLSRDTYKERLANLSSIGFSSAASWAADLYTEFGQDGNGTQPWNENVDSFHYNCDPASDPCDYSDLGDFNTKTVNITSDCRLLALLPYLSCLLDDAYKNFGQQNKDFDSQVSSAEDWFHRVVESQIDHLMFGTTDGSMGPGMKCMRLFSGPVFSEAYLFDCKFHIGDPGNWGSPIQQKACDQFTEYQFYSSTVMVEFSLRDDKGFFDTLASKDYGGLTRDMISFNNSRKLEHHCTQQQEGQTPIDGCIVNGDTYFQNYPGNWGMAVPDPRDLFGDVTVAQGQHWTTDTIDTYIRGLRTNTKVFEDAARDGTYTGELTDAVIALATPVLLLRQTVESMKAARDAAAKDTQARHDEWVENIMKIISDVLSSVGLASGVVGAAEGFIADLANLVNLALAAVGAVYTITTIVLHPTDWFNDLMSALSAVSAAGMMGGARAADIPDLFAKAANAFRKGITDEMAGKLGRRFEDDRNKLNEIVGKDKKGESCKAK